MDSCLNSSVQKINISVFDHIIYEKSKFLAINTSNIKSNNIVVLDLDETLIHSTFIKPNEYDFSISLDFDGIQYESFVRKRPYCDEFLQYVLNHFEVYFFTASIFQYTIAIISQLIPNFPQSKILTRQHCRFFNGHFIKELYIIPKKLSNILIIDDNSLAYSFNPSNGIQISSWTGDSADNQLFSTIIPILQHCYDANDVRIVLSKFKNQFLNKKRF